MEEPRPERGDTRRLAGLKLIRRVDGLDKKVPKGFRKRFLRDRNEKSAGWGKSNNNEKSCRVERATKGTASEGFAQKMNTVITDIEKQQTPGRRK